MLDADPFLIGDGQGLEVERKLIVVLEELEVCIERGLVDRLIEPGV
jgi:hypothetical protein